MMKVAVYITGGIAAYKAVNVVRLLQKNGHTVRVGMTKNSQNFVGSQTLAALTKYPVLDDLWEKGKEAQISHIELADWSDAAIVVPADANIIGKMAQGLADDAVSTTLLATNAPKFVVPAMNVHMWKNPALQRNLKLLKDDGVQILDPDNGRLAEGYRGKGRMPEPDKIYQWFIESMTKDLPLQGKKILVTAGGTREQIDPVRFIGNNSSGKMGLALATQADKLGAKVDLVYGQVSVPLPTNRQIKVHAIKSTEDLLTKVKELFKDEDALIMAAAPADFRPKKYIDHKIKKQKDIDDFQIEFEKTPDILKTIGQLKNKNQLVIGFAAETNDLLENAEKKLTNKKADYIIANDVSKGVFGSDENEVVILTKDGRQTRLPKMTKVELAKKILELTIEKKNKD